MLDMNSKDPVHFPAKSTVFEFDEEVTKIFDNMASRSIPMYDEARRLTVDITAEVVRKGWNYATPNVRILDVGSSTGVYYQDLWKVLGYDINEEIPGLEAIAMDNSPPMAEVTRDKLSGVATTLCNILDYDKELHGFFDVINLAYVLQFVPEVDRATFWKLVYSALKPGGTLILSTKEAIQEEYANFYDSEYIHFRERNGYTKEEIEAKTKALRGSMHVETEGMTRAYMSRVGFQGFQEVCRWLQFSTMVAHKQG